jgi:CHAT domain-containing protein/Tfp pilus assembly protein PilF
MALLLLVSILAGLPSDVRPPRCEALYQEGRRHYFAGRFADAQGAFASAQRCAREEGEVPDTLSQRYEGLCFQYEDRLDEALALFREAAGELERQERAGGWAPPRESASLADAWNNVGWVQHLRGENALARETLARALSLAPDGPAERAGSVWVDGRVRTNLAIATAALGDAAAAWRELEAVARVPSADRMNRTRALEHLGRLEESWGDLEAAAARYEEALATGEASLREDAPGPYNRAYVVGALSRLGLIQDRLGRTEEARDSLDRALAVARDLGTRRLVAQVLLDRGRLARDAGDLDAALAAHGEALALADAARLGPEEAHALAELGWDRLAGGDAQGALALFERALGSPAIAASPEAAAAIRAGIARAREVRGEISSASEEDDRAVAAIESIRLRDLPEPRRLGFWRLRQGVFRDAIALRHRLLEATGDDAHAARALELAEQSRSRTLLDLLGRGVVPAGPGGEAGAASVARLRAGLPGDDAGLVAYVLAEPRSWAFVLTRDECRMFALPGRAEIERAARAWRRRVASSDPYGRRAREDAARLGRMLLGPLAAAIAPLRRLLVAGDGVLHLVPFEALEHDRARLLLESHVVSYAPSLSVAVALHARHAGRARLSPRLLAYAAPSSDLGPLPLARVEASRIAALFPAGGAVLRAGEDASESWLKRTGGREFGALHFATHGRYDDRAPGRSGLVLAPGGGEDGLLQVREIASLALRARLVSLSACETGLGEMVSGEGVVGLARGFLDAGADAVAMTLWRIPDASTADLMTRFYGGLRAGRRAAEALREAKLELLRGRPGREAPFHWAGVVITGDADAALPEL